MQCIDKGIDDLVVQVPQTQIVEKTVEIPQLQTVEKIAGTETSSLRQSAGILQAHEKQPENDVSGRVSESCEHFQFGTQFRDAADEHRNTHEHSMRNTCTGHRCRERKRIELEEREMRIEESRRAETEAKEKERIMKQIRRAEMETKRWKTETITIQEMMTTTRRTSRQKQRAARQRRTTSREKERTTTQGQMTSLLKQRTTRQGQRKAEANLRRQQEKIPLKSHTGKRNPTE